MSEVWSFNKIFETYRKEKEKLSSVEIEKWLNIKANSPLVLKERKGWDDEIAIVLYILKEIDESKFKSWYEFWKGIFGRDFSVKFEEKRVVINWGDVNVR